MSTAIKGPPLPTMTKKMWHTVIHIDTENKPCGVEITNDPYEHNVKAAIIVHKTSSYNVAKQVSRFVRRATSQGRVSTHRAGTSKEAMLGYAVSRTMQFPPNERTPFKELVLTVSQHSVAQLLKMSDSTDNASRSRYTVLEIRSGEHVIGRIVTNKSLAMERLFECTPPDTDLKAYPYLVSRFEDHNEAKKACGSLWIDYKTLWTRKPSREYITKMLEDTGEGEFVYTRNKFSAMRNYDYGRFVQVGPHIYTRSQIVGVFAYGGWTDGRVSKVAVQQAFQKPELDDHTDEVIEDARN